MSGIRCECITPQGVRKVFSSEKELANYLGVSQRTGVYHLDKWVSNCKGNTIYRLEKRRSKMNRYKPIIGLFTNSGNKVYDGKSFEDLVSKVDHNTTLTKEEMRTSYIFSRSIKGYIVKEIEQWVRLN